jgi:uncharacterized protein (UPF0335 family)
MGIQIGSKISVEFDAQQIAQLDNILQSAEAFLYNEEGSEVRKARLEDQISNIYKAIHGAGYR